MSTNSEHLLPFRPEPFEEVAGIRTVGKHSNLKTVSEELLSGSTVLVEDQYPVGLAVLAEIRKVIFGRKSKHNLLTPGSDFKEYRERRTRYRQTSNQLLVPIRNHRIALKKAPAIGWLKILYPDRQDFYLTFPQIQGLNSSWQWYQNGIAYPVLNKRLHPWYGVYFPTRFDHLHLFEAWLSDYPGSRTLAMDIGTGCGVLSFQMIKHRFEKVLATDIVPNAIISVNEDLRRQNLDNNLETRLSNLFDRCDERADVIVFNPPWLPSGTQTGWIDRAVYYDPQLFERFFDQAPAYLRDGGRILVFFSNLGRKEGLWSEHPIKRELDRNRYLIEHEYYRRKAARPSRKTLRRNHRFREYVELWELGLS